MPAPDASAERPDGRLLNGLFWAGVGLAPLAALLLLIGQDGGPLRVAVVLALLAVILIGLSVTLRSRSRASRFALEDQLLDEIETLRNDVRADIATAARATHRAFGEKLQVLYQQVEVLRGQLDAIRAEAGRGGYDRAASGPAGPASAGSYPPSGSYPQESRGGSTAAAGQAPMGAPNARQSESGQPGAGGRAYVAGGVVRHTETVQVTTRQTIVDPVGDDPNRGTVYGGGANYGGGTYGGATYGGGTYGARSPEPAPGEWSEPARRTRRSSEPDEDSWRDQRPHDARGAGGYGREEPAADGRYSELRMGERRAAMRADESGTELRIEDRWAAVRRDEARRDEARWDDPRRDEAQWGGDRWGDRPHWDERQPRWNDAGDRRDDDSWQGEERTGTGHWEPADTGSWNAREPGSWVDGQAGSWENGQSGSWGNGQSGSWSEARWDRALPPGGIEVTGPWTQDWIESEREPVRERRDRRDGGYDDWR